MPEHKSFHLSWRPSQNSSIYRSNYNHTCWSRRFYAWMSLLSPTSPISPSLGWLLLSLACDFQSCQVWVLTLSPHNLSLALVPIISFEGVNQAGLVSIDLFFEITSFDLKFATCVANCWRPLNPRFNELPFGTISKGTRNNVSMWLCRLCSRKVIYAFEIIIF